MAASKKNNHFDNYLLKGKLRKNGFERWRYVFTGINRATGEQKTFFVELYYVNPLLSPKNPVIAQKSRPKLSVNDLQYALAGTAYAQAATEELSVLPSYALIKAGYFGKGGKQLNKFLPSNSLSYVKSEKIFKIDECVFGTDLISGSISVSQQDLTEHPEFLCSTGEMTWNLHFEKNIESGPMCNNKTNFWMPGGAKSVFAGLIHVDGQEYAVIPRSSSGYIDKSWGSLHPNPFFHLSSSNITSAISGRPLTRSCFAVEGEFDGRLSIFLDMEGVKFKLSGKSLFDKYSEIHNWSEMPADADGEKLHWTVSIQKNRYIIDMELYCKTNEMFVRDYEIPQGERKLLKILGGGTGFGEIRMYKKVNKNLELLEHANVLDAICEYGTIDSAEE